MTDHATRREGWYADPLGQADLRWWDSQRWTTQVTASSHSKAHRHAEEPRPVALQWADDELPADEPLAGSDRVAPPAPQSVPEPKLAIGSKPESKKATLELTAQGGSDWSPLALALLTAGDRIVTATASGIPTITIDMVERTYWWDRPLESFPTYPADLVVSSVPRSDATKPTVAGRYIEPLLWHIGTGAETLFTRVDPALRYKLRRWPDLTTIPHTAEQVRAMKLLATAQLTTTELGAIAGITENDLRTLIGTFGLMSLLDSVKDPAGSR